MISPSYEKIYICESWNFKILNFCLKQFIFRLSEVVWIFWQQNVSLSFLCHYWSFMRFIFMKNNLKIVRYSCTTKREIERIVTILQSLVWKWDSMKLHETRNSLINSMIWKGTQQWNNFIFENLNITLAYNRRSWYIREATYWFDSCYSYWQYINNMRFTRRKRKIFSLLCTRHRSK